MRWSVGSINRIAASGHIWIRAPLAFLISGGLCLPSLGADIQKGTPEAPLDIGAFAGNYICHDGNAYRVVLSLNSNGTYSANGSSCLKSKGNASGVGRWKLSDGKIVLAPSKEKGWMIQEPKTFKVLKFKCDWIFVRADWPDYYNRHGVTDVSCFQRQAAYGSYAFVADEELPRLLPFRAVVEQKQPCAAYLKTSDGRRLCIGGPGATKDVAGFVGMLEEGRTYQLPEAFLKYREEQNEH